MDREGESRDAPGAAGEAAGERPVRVLVNALHARTGGGLTYLTNLLPGLAADPGLEVHLGLHADQEESGLESLDGRLHVHLFRFPSGFTRRLLWEQAVLPFAARRIGAEVVFSPANFGPLLAPRPVVLLRNALDVGRTETRPLKRLYWGVLAAMTWASLLRAPRALAVSAYAARSLSARLPESVRARISVVHHGVAPSFSPPAPGARREGFLLAVGDIYIQKNLHGLLLALDRLRGDHPDIHLKIAGRPVDPDYARRIDAIIAERRLGDRVELLGHVPPDGLVDLYRRCALFVFPSLVETFGNPLVEAMACGAPIVSAGTAAMPEVLGDAGLFFDPGDPGQMAAQIARALGDEGLRQRLSAKAVARARRFSWPETARRTADILKRCARS